MYLDSEKQFNGDKLQIGNYNLILCENLMQIEVCVYYNNCFQLKILDIHHVQEY